MENHLDLVFTIDGNYIQHFSVALVSVLENNNNLNFRVFVINNIQDEEIKNKINTFFFNNYTQTITFLSVNDDLFDRYPISHHVSKATYFRLMIADILPEFLEEVIFLDSDIIVTGSLKELSVRSDYFICAVKEASTENYTRLNRLGIPATKYFNAGIMILNLTLWRKHKSVEGLMRTADKFKENLLWWDQDVLNIYFYDKWFELNPTYNSLHLLHKYSNAPVIIHYAGSSKPWDFMNKHPYKAQYWKYLRRTPFKNYRPADLTARNIIKRIYQMLLSKG